MNRTFLIEAEDLLQALLDAEGPEGRTVRRLVAWYAEVAAELGCQEEYAALAARLLHGLRPRGRAPTTPFRLH